MAYFRKPNSTQIVDDQGNVTTDPNVMSSIGDLSKLPLYGQKREARSVDPLAQLKQKLAGEITNQLNAPDTSNTDRENINNLFSARLAEIQQRTDQRTMAEEAAGRQAEAQATGVNFRAGLAGSDFASSRRVGVQQKTAQAVSAIKDAGQAEKDALRSEQDIAIQNIEDRATQRQQERLGLLQKGVDLIEGEQDKAYSDFTTLAKAGNDWSQIEGTPGLLEEIQQQTGKSVDYLKFAYQANLPKDQYTEPQYHWDNGNLVAINFDKATGKVSTQTFSAGDLGIPEGTDVKVLPADDFGNIYWYDAKQLGNGEAKLNKLGSVGVAPKATSGGSIGGGTGGTDDVGMIAQAIINGNQPPVVSGLYGKTAAVRAELERQGFDYTKANQDFTATGKLLATLNGAQQTRLRQAINFTADSLDLMTDLNKGAEDAMSRAGITAFATVQKKAAMQGVFGQEVKSAFTKLDNQVSDLVSELATVYKGGNSSTDESLKLAAKQLNSNWDYQTFKDNIDLVRKNLQIRNNSINLATGGISDSQYNPMDNPESSPSQTMTDEEAYQEYLKQAK